VIDSGLSPGQPGLTPIEEESMPAKTTPPRIRFTGVTHSGARGYDAVIEADGVPVGRVHRPDRPSGLGYRSADYRATIEGRTVATGRTIADIKADLAEEFAGGRPPDPDQRDFNAMISRTAASVRGLISAGNVYADRVNMQNALLDVVQEEFDRAATEAARRQFGGQS
jgi:hypothetical protein